MAWYQDPDCKLALMFTGEASGDDAADSSVIGNTMTDQGGLPCLRSASGKFGDCLETTGGDMAMGISDAAQVFLNMAFDEWTIAFWVKSDGVWTAVGAPTMLNNGTVTHGYNIYYDAAGSKKIKGEFTDNLGTTVTVEQDSATADSTWIHVAFTRRKDTIYLYIDGQLQSDTAAFIYPLQDTGETITIAAANDLGVASLLDGFMDDVCFFSRSLTAAELASLIAEGLTGPNPVIVSGILSIRDHMDPQVSTRLEATGIVPFTQAKLTIADVGKVSLDDPIQGALNA